MTLERNKDRIRCSFLFVSSDWMPIPPLTDLGFLPPGVHDATLEEVEERYGRFRSSEKRVELFTKLRQYLTELTTWGHVQEVLIDGSFVSSKESPNDIDLIIVYRQSFDISTEVSPSEYNCLKGSRARAIFSVDCFAVFAEDPTYQKMTTFFGQDTRRTGLSKGLIRIAL